MRLRPCIVEQSPEWLSCSLCLFGSKRTGNLEVAKIKVNSVTGLFEPLDIGKTMKQAAHSAIARLAEVWDHHPADKHWAWATAAFERQHCDFYLDICQGGVEGMWCEHLAWATIPLMWSFSLSRNQNCLNSYLSSQKSGSLVRRPTRYQLRQTTCGSQTSRLRKDGLVFVIFLPCMSFHRVLEMVFRFLNK